jgi:hypothetical protein
LLAVNLVEPKQASGLDGNVDTNHTNKEQNP